ncbi:putative bifunctional diguanylate cyclase/phosphodiesterase, partial [Geodermatophilus chilensis]|uniref:putative bifunctional diguanylate cyclase/phosphodiesterase n=1 Tax=Geodermatophilus chilensis TaxID=2035835 RepID=UPI000C263CDF
MFRILTSWRALLAVLAVAVTGLALLAQSLERQQEERALRQAVVDAELVNHLLIAVELPGEGVEVTALSPGLIARIDSGVAHLVHEGSLVGLQLWTRDGRLLYSDVASPDPLTDEELAHLDEVLDGRPQVEFELDDGRKVPTATVLSEPRTLDHGASGLVTEVLLPQDGVTEKLEAASRRLYAGAAGLLPLVTVLAVTARRRVLRREHEALHDPLTGLGNRSMLAQEARTLGAPRRSWSTPDEPVTALLLIDLDGFNNVNDTLGHAVGDQLLVQVAGALRGAVRPADVVTRLGGDEFALLLRNLPSAAAAVRVAESVAATLTRPFAVDRVTLEVGGSIGVAVAPDHGSDLAALLRRADVAMYQAKRDGGGVRLYDSGDDPHDEGQLDLLSQLRTAIDTGQLWLHFQPKVALGAGRTVGFEALVRWAHPERGLLAPAAFVPLAARTALMRPLTDWVLREAVKQCAAWRAQGWEVDVAVNVAPGTLLEGDLPSRVTTMLAEGGLPGHALELEITETAVMVDPERAAETLRRLQAMGIGVSIDDFGAGYTSLSYLKSLPVRSLKIDRGFVTHLLDDDRDQAVIRSVVQLGHDLGLTVVAEGVETAGVRQRLLELGCDEAQGYLMARPMASEAVLDWLAASAAARGAQLSSTPRTTDTREWDGSPSSGSTETSTTGYHPGRPPAAAPAWCRHRPARPRPAPVGRPPRRAATPRSSPRRAGPRRASARAPASRRPAPSPAAPSRRRLRDDHDVVATAPHLGEGRSATGGRHQPRSPPPSRRRSWSCGGDAPGPDGVSPPGLHDRLRSGCSRSRSGEPGGAGGAGGVRVRGAGCALRRGRRARRRSRRRGRSTT